MTKNNRISNWFNLSKQYLFTFKNGFFNLSFLANSPELIIKSAIKMPFVNHEEEKQKLSLNSPFVKGDCYYANLEKGLWVVYSNLYYKNNVSFSPIYDNQLPSDYFCIAINFNENIFNSDYYLFNSINVKDQTINFIQPKGDTIHCHFKGSKNKMYIFYLSKKWIENNVIPSSEISEKTKEIFTKGQNRFINYNYDKRVFSDVINDFEKCFRDKINILALKKQTLVFLELFLINSGIAEGIEVKNLSLNINVKIKKVEQFLLNNLYQKFPGIDFLAKKFNISPTKLKTDFKKIHQTSLLKYYQEKQMQLALAELEKGSLVKDVSKKFNYENVSKFSKTFQKYNNILPSQIK
jgi:AraC-like DNA-binding protein